nr:MAG TPA: hypothetical protein [Crassvirales sp.]
MDKNKLSALEKFALLPNITIFEEGEFTKVDKEQDEGYTPTLYWYYKAYCVDWISEENDTILGFNGDTPEEAINKAFDFCLSEKLIEL